MIFLFLYRAFLEAAGCPAREEDAARAMGGLDKHSQGNMFDKDRQKGVEWISGEGWDRAREIFEEVGLSWGPRASLGELKAVLRK